DLPLDVFSLRQARAAAVKAEDIRRVALTYLRPEAMRVFVVGDAAAIRGDLEKLGLGEVEVRQTEAETDSSSSHPDACGRH
ncbi:MAG TPA: insulinase family protein, partial [Polyangium sp.]|nr:insulinase family protein [Polyangium sp.]